MIVNIHSYPIQQTRRVTRRADENAPPAISERTRSRSTAAVPTVKSNITTAGGASKIPVLKRTTSAASTNTTSRPAALDKVNGGAGATRRAALGEVKNTGKDKSKDAGADGGKGKGAGVERKPLASTTTTQGAPRRTRPTASAVGTASTAGPAGKEERPVLKRKTTATASSSQPTQTTSKSGAKVHVPVRSRSTTATSAPEHRLKERSLNADADTGGSIDDRSGSTTIRASDKTELVEPEPVRKKRKTSSPVAVTDEFKDLVDEAVYDVDGREIVLSSGGRGTAMASPKASRPKDYGWTDLDAEDEGDPSMVAEYVVDAFNYMMSIEVRLSTAQILLLPISHSFLSLFCYRSQPAFPQHIY